MVRLHGNAGAKREHRMSQSHDVRNMRTGSHAARTSSPAQVGGPDLDSGKASSSERKGVLVKSFTEARSGRHVGAGSVTMLLAVVALLLSSLLPALPAAAQEPRSDWSPPSTVYIPETGHTLDQLFLDLWRGAGGAAAFGNPVTAEIAQPNGHIVQYLEFARFEYLPEGDEHGNTVILGKIGEELRPVTVPRSVASFKSPANQGTSDNAAAIESARQMKAWLPITAAQVGSEAVFIEATGHSVGGGFKTFWENTGGAEYLGNPLTEEYALGGTTYQVFERGQLAWQQGKDPWLVPVGKLLADKYKLDQQPIAQADIPTYSEELFIPPPEPTPEPEPEIAAVPNGETWIDINLSAQYMVVYGGDAVIFETYISSGAAGFETPAGTFFINSKTPVQDMEGVIGGEYYNVPEVPSVMYFTGEGHAIHGTYWHSNFGAPMSHGCINVPMDLAAYLYELAPIGTRVEIHF
jgi:lipoprotein-anchoring transpeptidase ErfK/SrfK